jgi:hypothetical protein
MARFMNHMGVRSNRDLVEAMPAFTSPPKVARRPNLYRDNVRETDRWAERQADRLGISQGPKIIWRLLNRGYSVDWIESLHPYDISAPVDGRLFVFDPEQKVYQRRL